MFQIDDLEQSLRQINNLEQILGQIDNKSMSPNRRTELKHGGIK